jgi:fluoroquinolone transport system permease protein
MGMLHSLTLTELRNLNRDALLRTMVLLPWLLAPLMAWVIPLFADALADRIDLRPYFGMLTSFFSLLLMPQLLGYVIGFMLLDERDDGTLTVLQVTPLSLERYLLYKLSLPFVVSIGAAYVFVAVVGLIDPPYGPLLPIALLAALEAPLFALMLASLAGNKVQGLAVMKGLGFFGLAAIAAYFTPMPWQWFWGISPTYWPVRAFWAALAGEAWAPYVAVGLVVHLLYLWAMWRRFRVILSR